MEKPTEHYLSELRRGTLVLSVLSQLEEQQYGYSLKERLSNYGIEIEQGTLYPLLRRLESQGLLESEWVVAESRPRRYYQLNKKGEEILDTLLREWQHIVESLKNILGDMEQK